MRIPIIIDCDPGVDDALAIILALMHPKIDLQAVCSVTGNGNLDNTTNNGLKILSLCGREDIPLYRGSAKGLNDKQPDTVPAFGDDGLGGYAYTVETNKEAEKENAADFLVRAANEKPGELTLFSIGPCTNIAKAIRKDGEFPKKIKRIIVMGGSKYTGNMSPVAEYNFWADPLAAKEVMNAGFHDIVMIGLDVTNKIALGADIREILRIFDTDLSKFIYNITKEGLDDNWKCRRKPVAPMHDVLTVAYLIDESILAMKKAHIDIVTEGIAKGQSVVDIDGHWFNGQCNALYATDVDVNKFYQLFLTTIFKEHKEEILDYLK
ncbi:MAG: nucleoside hydrolase [Lachnospiraceae bacterium]|jgi:purine nucleosidase|nr:nucleoside hydrolase [Lachnospiraceae bacterium]MCI9342438.1 nucleoside hydrolase [Lachnospiraceae bacterium]